MNPSLTLKALLLSPLCALALLAGCSGRYDSQVEANFTNSCQAKGETATFCQCYLRKTEDKLSQKELTDLEQDMLLTQRVPDKIAATAMDAKANCPR